MCQVTIPCPRCDALLTDADEVRCSRSSLGTDMGWLCRRCGSTVSLTSKAVEACIPRPARLTVVRYTPAIPSLPAGLFGRADPKENTCNTPTCNDTRNEPDCSGSS